MPDLTLGSQISAHADEARAAFTVEGAPLRGRIVRLGAGALDPILRRHDYPAPVALLLGEMVLFAALMGGLLKAEGRLIVQAQGDGPAPLMVAEHRSDGGVRAYARLAPDGAARMNGVHRMAPRELIGEGVFAVTLDQGPDFTPHQGFVPLDGDTLAQCAEAYFRDSEQTDTRIHLSIGEVFTRDGPPTWRGGGALIQKVAADDARGETEEGWSRATIFFATLSDVELLDPELSSAELLLRLYHEDGVRMSPPEPLTDSCSCTQERLLDVLQQMPKASIADLVEPDGLIHAKCQFCARVYEIGPEKLGA